MQFSRKKYDPPDWLADAIERLWDKTTVRLPAVYLCLFVNSVILLLGYYVALVAIWGKCGYEMAIMVLMLLVASNFKRLAN